MDEDHHQMITVPPSTCSPPLPEEQPFEEERSDAEAEPEQPSTLTKAPSFSLETIEETSSTEESTHDSSPSTSEASSGSAMRFTSRPSTAPSSTQTSLTDVCSPTQSASDTCMPTSILRPTLLPRSHSTNSISVSFAPLPELDPRRRPCAMPLGVAARSRMLRARRMRTMSDVEDMQHDDMGHPHYASIAEQQEAIAAYQSETTVRIYAGGEDEVEMMGSGSRKPVTPLQSFWRSATSGMSTPEEDAIAQNQDALLALGRLMKGGARTLWRRVSQSSLRSKEKKKGVSEGLGTETRAEDAEVEVKIVGVGVVKNKPVLRKSASVPQRMGEEESVTVHVVVNQPRHLLEDPPHKASSIDVDAVPLTIPAKTTEEFEDEEEGRVWEEQVGDDVTRRMEALAQAQAQEQDKEKKPAAGIVRFSSLRRKVR